MGPWESTPSTSSHENPARCTGRNHPWVHGRAHHPRASTSILCKAHGSMGEHPIHEHPRASCALHKQGSLMGPWESTIQEHSRASWALQPLETLMGPCESTPSTSIHEQPVRCTGRDRSWVHVRAPHARASASILSIAQARIAHGSMVEHPIYEQPREPCALHRWGSLMGPMGEHPVHEHP